MKNPKNIIIFGCNSGLGRGLTDFFLSKGHNVFGTSRGKNLYKDKQLFTHFNLEITNNNEIDDLIDFFKKGRKKIDLVINCIAKSSNQFLIMSNTNKLKDLININVVCYYKLIKKLSKYILGQKDNSIFVGFSSIHADTPVAGASFYSMSKKCVENLTISFAEEFKRTNISYYCMVLSYITNIGLAREINDEIINRHLDKNENAHKINLVDVTNSFEKLLERKGQFNPLIKIGC